MMNFVCFDSFIHSVRSHHGICTVNSIQLQFFDKPHTHTHTNIYVELFYKHNPNSKIAFKINSSKACGCREQIATIVICAVCHEVDLFDRLANILPHIICKIHVYILLLFAIGILKNVPKFSRNNRQSTKLIETVAMVQQLVI